MSAREGDVRSARNNDIARIHRFAVTQIVVAECPMSAGAPGQATPPGFHMVHEGGEEVRQGCGSLVAEITGDAAVRSFVSTVCGGIDSKECTDRFTQMVLARLQERYRFANWQSVSNKCAAYPVDCAHWAEVEMWVRESHNSAVVEWAKTSYAERDREASAQIDGIRREEDTRTRAAFAAFSQALTPPPTVHCTSQTMGSTTQTECH